MSAGPLHIDAAGAALRVVQITDTHLNRIEGGTLLGLDTDFSLQQVLQRVLAERDSIDLVLATGDIADNGSEEAYLRARDYFSRLAAPVLWLPGNHDRAEVMAAVLGQRGELQRTAETGHWQVLMLNSQIPGAVGGRLGAGELQTLRSCLEDAARRSQHVLVCLHHQPVAMGSAWIDRQMLADSEDFLALLGQFDCVRGVLWGHVHQQLDRDYNGWQLMATPSSCVQFAPGSDAFKADDAPPGYRWLDLLADGRIETGVSRVTGVAFNVDLASAGYL